MPRHRSSALRPFSPPLPPLRGLLAGLLLIACGASVARGESVRVRLEYRELEQALAAGAGPMTQRLPDYELLTVPGAPALPVVAEPIVLPAGTVARSVVAVSVTTIRLPIALEAIPPVQPPAILGLPGVTVEPPARVPPDRAVYYGDALYPARLATLQGTGRLAELAIASCAVHPVQFDPVTRELILHPVIDLTLELETDPGIAGGHDESNDKSNSAADGESDSEADGASVQSSSTSGTAARQAPSASRGSPAAQRLIEELTRRQTPQGGTAAPGADGSPVAGSSSVAGLSPTSGLATELDPAAYQYVIVTSQNQLGPWETYAAWKTAKGVPATVITTEWIQRQYGGRDTAERIRHFLIDAVRDWETTYVLLAGDEPVVPSRVTWAFDCDARLYANENDLSADLYYADLDGTWDDNQNGIFGEVEDNVDLYPDIFVGRAPSADVGQANSMVVKFMQYERTPATDYTETALLFGEILWFDPYTDSGRGLDMVADRHLTPAGLSIERQYESLGNESVSSVVAALGEGRHIAMHAGHAFHDVMGCGSGYLRNEAVSALTNAPRYTVLYSIGCWPAALDYDSIGERFVTNGTGGAVAFIGNSRYGWGSPGNPGWGYSETFGADFIGALLTDGITQFGPALARAKILRIPYSHGENVYRWHQYQVNLLGDPEMSCHSGPIRSLTLTAPGGIPAGTTQFTATVTDETGVVAGARLCLAGADIYQVGLSDQHGQVVFTPTTAGSQTLTLTATAANHIFDELTIGASGPGASLAVARATIDDDAHLPSTGDADGALEAGETVELFVAVQNLGGMGCTGVTGRLTLDDPALFDARVTLIDSVAVYGAIAAGDQVTSGTPFTFAIAADCPAGVTIPFRIVFTADSGAIWAIPVPLRVGAGLPKLHDFEVAVVLGDRDALIEPGETLSLTVEVTNVGDATLAPLVASIESGSAELLVMRGSAATPTVLAPGEIATLTPAFEIRVGDGAAATTVGEIQLTLSSGVSATAGGGGVGSPIADAVVETLRLAIGEPGFADDVEVGTVEWTTEGTADAWRRTDFRQHSGSFSWYCGTDQQQYRNSTDAALLSPRIVVPAAAELSFWCYFDVTIYGTDGLFVDYERDGEWVTLDYIGSGGALDPLLFVADWAERAYDLSDLEPGSTTRLRFRFSSDRTDTDEGFYVDDVTLRSTQERAVDVPEIDGAFALSSTLADRASSDVAWRLTLLATAEVAVDLYDVNGHLVERLRHGSLPAGGHELRWDGSTVRGFTAPTGIYFLRLRVDEQETIRKVLRLR